LEKELENLKKQNEQLQEIYQKNSDIRDLVNSGLLDLLKTWKDQE
ncbi:15654_t:CDS:2, partial [Funneliformis geosporum]